MKRGNKYYIPNLEEFHVGFEYEEKSVSSDNYFPRIATKDILINDLDKFDGDCVRTKYLDREDIESLGWKFVKQYPGLDDMTFYMNHKDLDLILDFESSNHIRIYESYEDGDFNWFTGTIKNKSELKKLLIQLIG